MNPNPPPIHFVSYLSPLLQLLLFLLVHLSILDRIPLGITNRFLKLLRLLGTIRKQVLLDEPLRRLTKPLEQAEILVLVCAEDFQYLDVFIVRKVFDEVAHVARNDAHIAGLEVESARCAFGGENGHSGAAFDEEGPLVCVGCGNELERDVLWRSE